MLKTLQDIIDKESCKESSLMLQKINKESSKKIKNNHLISLYTQWVEETNPDAHSIYGAGNFLEFLLKQNT